MAKKGDYVKGHFDETLALGTLASKVVTSSSLTEVMEDTGRITSVQASYSLMALTQAANVGPIAVGWAHGDYSSAEIEEYLENAGSWNRGAKIEQEIAKRLIRQIGVFPDRSGGPTAPQVLNNGSPIKTRLNWQIQEGETIKLWVYNQGSAAVATTDPQCQALGHANIFY